MTWGEPVTRIRAGTSPGPDPYGNPLPGVDVQTVIEGAAFDPGGSREPVEVGRTQTITTPKVFFMDAWPDIVESDRLVVRGRTFTVQGRPPAWRSPWSGMGGLVVELQEVED